MSGVIFREGKMRDLKGPLRESDTETGRHGDQPSLIELRPAGTETGGHGGNTCIGVSAKKAEMVIMIGDL